MTRVSSLESFLRKASLSGGRSAAAAGACEEGACEAELATSWDGSRAPRLPPPRSPTRRADCEPPIADDEEAAMAVACCSCCLAVPLYDVILFASARPPIDSTAPLRSAEGVVVSSSCAFGPDATTRGDRLSAAASMRVRSGGPAAVAQPAASDTAKF